MGYLNRLSRDLDRWIERGWVDAAHRDDILGDARSRAIQWTAAGALAIMGAVLLAMSVVSFIAANWDGMVPGLRFLAILAALWIALLASGRALDKGVPALGHALAVLGTALFGLAIMLTAQTFHMASFKNDALLIWTIAALCIAVALNSRPVLILSAVLGAWWVIAETNNPFMPDVMYGYLIVWGITAFAANRLRSLVTMNLLGLALMAWLGHLIASEGDTREFGYVSIISIEILVFAILALLAAMLRDRAIYGSGVVAGWATVWTVGAGFGIQIPLANYDDWVVRVRENDQITSWLSLEERWAQVIGEHITGYTLIAVLALGIIGAIVAFRLIWRQTSRFTAFAFFAGALMTAVIPFAAAGLGPDMVLVLRVMTGAVFYALAVALIIQGARAGHRLTGGIGVVAFIVQTLYVYAETFRDLLGVSLFFAVGGLILVAVSTALLKLRKRIAAPAPAATPEGETS